MLIYEQANSLNCWDPNEARYDMFRRNHVSMIAEFCLDRKDVMSSHTRFFFHSTRRHNYVHCYAVLVPFRNSHVFRDVWGEIPFPFDDFSCVIQELFIFFVKGA